MKILKKSLLTIIAFTLAAVLASTPVFAGDSAAGKGVYDGKGACAACHGATGAGDGVAAATLTPKPASFVTASFRFDTNADGQPGSDTDIADVIKYGAAKYGGNVSMPGRADLTDEEVSNLVAYIHAMKQ